MDSEIFAGCVCNTHPEIFEEGILIDCRPCIMRVLIFEGIYVYSRGGWGTWGCSPKTFSQVAVEKHTVQQVQVVVFSVLTSN